MLTILAAPFAGALTVNRVVKAVRILLPIVRPVLQPVISDLVEQLQESAAAAEEEQQAISELETQNRKFRYARWARRAVKRRTIGTTITVQEGEDEGVTMRIYTRRTTFRAPGESPEKMGLYVDGLYDSGIEDLGGVGIIPFSKIVRESVFVGDTSIPGEPGTYEGDFSSINASSQSWWGVYDLDGNRIGRLFNGETKTGVWSNAGSYKLVWYGFQLGIRLKDGRDRPFVDYETDPFPFVITAAVPALDPPIPVVEPRPRKMPIDAVPVPLLGTGVTIQGNVTTTVVIVVPDFVPQAGLGGVALNPDGTRKPVALPAPVPTEQGLEIPWPGAAPVGHAAARPRANLVSIARELGRQEQKMSQIGAQTAGGSGGVGGLSGMLGTINDLLDIITKIRDLLDEGLPSADYSYPGGSYQLAPVCERDNQGQLLPPVTVDWEGGNSREAEINAKLDAIADLLQIHKVLKQPVCKGSPPIGAGVTVTFEEILA